MKDLLDNIFEEMDLLDSTELDPEDKVVYSKEMTDRIRSEIRKEIAKIPIGKIITKVLSKETQKNEESVESLKNSVSKEIGQTKTDVKNEVSKLKTEITDFMDKIKKKYDDLKGDFLSISGKQWYQFGGFSPQVNDLNIGDPSIEGAWRIVKSGTTLSVQRFESGVWIEKGSFLP